MISVAVSIICHGVILGNATYSGFARRAEITLEHTKRARAREFFASNENRVHLFTHAISLDFHSRSPFYSLPSQSK